MNDELSLPIRPTRGELSGHCRESLRQPYLRSHFNLGRTVTTNQGKTNAFMKEYAAVNRFCFDKEEGDRIRQLKSTLKSPTAGESCVLPCGKRSLMRPSPRCVPKTPQANTISPQPFSKPSSKTRSCASCSRSVTDIRPPSRRRPSWPFLTTPRN